MNTSQKFSPTTHVPKYTKNLFSTLATPLVIYFALVGNIILGSLMLLFYYFEKDINPDVTNLFDAFWWGLVTVTTVGYGDTVPITIEGKIVAMFLMVGGVIFFVSFTAILVSFLLSHSGETIEQKVLLELRELHNKVDSFIVKNSK